MTGETPDNPGGEDRDLLAAEYALGAGDSQSRRQVENLMADDRDFALQVARWQELLVPMASSIEAVSPPAALKERVEARLFGAADNNRVARWYDSVAFWRPLALASLFVVAGLGFLQVSQPDGARDQGRLVIALAPVGDAEAQFVAVFASDGGVRVALPDEAVADKDRELWLIEGENPPISLGVLPRSGIADLSLTPDIAGRLRAGATLAISLEPEGGSPTGQPTGPVIAAGQALSL